VFDSHTSSRREALISMAGAAGFLAMAADPAAAADERKGSSGDAAGRDQTLRKFAPPEGKQVELRDGEARSVEVAGVIRTASHTFEFRRANGEAEEKTVAVSRPAGAGFIVMVQDLYYAFMSAASGNTLRERPLGQFVVDVGMRGDNLVCKVRLTDVNADDPVSISVTAGVLFFN